MGKIADYINGFAFKPTDWKKSGKKIIRIKNLTGTSKEYNFTDRTDIPEKYLIKSGELLISWSATIGFYIWNNEDAYLNQHIFKVTCSDVILKKYLYFMGKMISTKIIEQVHGNTMQHITKGRFESIKIPLPSLEVQGDIVAKAEEEEKIIITNNNLIKLMLAKIDDVLNQL